MIQAEKKLSDFKDFFACELSCCSEDKKKKCCEKYKKKGKFCGSCPKR